MTLSLYQATVPGFIQTLGGVKTVLQRGLDHCSETGRDPDTLVGERIHADMLPLLFQVYSVEHHSLGAIEGVKAGVFGPPSGIDPISYAGLQEKVDATITGLKALSQDEVDALSGGDMRFEMGETKIPFTAEGFLLSFSLPNLHFHATTAYDILRMQGVPLGKRDYLGQLQVKA